MAGSARCADRTPQRGVPTKDLVPVAGGVDAGFPQVMNAWVPRSGVVAAAAATACGSQADFDLS
jgi:hypothetical protein